MSPATLAVLATMLVAGGARAETTAGTVERTGKTLTVRGADGKSATFHVRLKDGKPDPEQEVSIGKALRRGLPVTVDWTKGADGNRYIDSLASNGTVTGRVVASPENFILLVDTPKLGRLRFGARWIQVGQEWQPDPKEIALIASAKPGANVSVTYVLEEYLRINELKVLE